MANEKETNNAPERKAKNSEFLRSLDDFSPEAEEVSASKKRAFGNGSAPCLERNHKINTI